MRALVSMPRSPTSTTSARPKRSRSFSTVAGTVAGSAVSPGTTSTATGRPSASVTRPYSIWSDARPPVTAVAAPRERAVAALDRGGGEVVEDEAAGSQVARREARLDALLALQQPVHRAVQLVLVRVGHPQRRRASVLCVQRRVVASFEPGASRRAAIMRHHEVALARGPALDEPLEAQRAQRAQHGHDVPMGQAAPDLEGRGRGQEALAQRGRGARAR